MSTDLVEALNGTIVESLSRFFKPIAHADCVYSCPPTWVRASGAEALLGIRRDFLNGLVAKKLVTAKKADKIVLYKFADILAAIDKMDNLKITKKGK